MIGASHLGHFEFMRVPHSGQCLMRMSVEMKGHAGHTFHWMSVFIPVACRLLSSLVAGRTFDVWWTRACSWARASTRQVGVAPPSEPAQPCAEAGFSRTRVSSNGLLTSAEVDGVDETEAPDPTGERALIETFRRLSPTARATVLLAAACGATDELGDEAPLRIGFLGQVFMRKPAGVTAGPEQDTATVGSGKPELW